MSINVAGMLMIMAMQGGSEILASFHCHYEDRSVDQISAVSPDLLNGHVSSI